VAAQTIDRAGGVTGECIDVALGFDRAFVPHAAAVIASVVRHAPGASFRFVLLHSGVERDLRARVELAAPEARFHWAEIGDDEAPAMSRRDHFSRAILFRLGLDKHAPAECRRIIYLDADVIVTDDIRALWRADLSGAPLGAVVDCFVDAEAFAERWGLPTERASYFNSGVLLIDLERVRQDGIFARALEFAAAQLPEIRFPDQDALNYVCWERWARLDTIWNAQRHMAITSLCTEIPEERQLRGRAPAIVHFTGPEKPWLNEGYHPWAWLYWENLARTPFLGEISRRHGVNLFKRVMLWQRYVRQRA